MTFQNPVVRVAALFLLLLAGLLLLIGAILGSWPVVILSAAVAALLIAGLTEHR